MGYIRLFRSTETDFTHNEWILNEIVASKTKEVINDDYTTELEYPLEDTKGISSNLVVGGIISIPTIDSRSDQLFRIIDKETTSNTIILQMQVKLLADLKENRVRAMTITGLTRKQAIQKVLNAALEPHSYEVGNLDTNSNANVIVNIEEGNLLSALIGDENSILSEYGGEFIVNNNTIDIVDSRGSDNGVVIGYGKNLSSIKEKINNTDLATVLIPRSGDYRLPEYCIESANVKAYEKRYFKEVELNLNIWDGTDTKKDDQITLNQAYELMRSTCNKMFTIDKVDQMSFNYSIDFIQLSKTEEYKNYSILENVILGDIVTVKHKKLNLNLQGRVNEINYTVDSEGKTTIDTVEIGFSRKDITDIIKDTVKQINFVKDEILLSVNNSVDHVTAEFKIADNAIKQSVTDLDNKTSSALTLQSNKISAVVESNDGGMTWTLNKDAFIIACKGASNSNVTIDSTGLIVNNGKMQVKNSSNKTVFYVNTNGKCNAVGGFYVDDGSGECCRITIDGLKLTNSNGYTGTIKAHPDHTALLVSDDMYIGKDLRIDQDLTVTGYVEIGNYGYVDKDFTVGRTLFIGDKTLQEIIDARIRALK